MGAFSWLFGNSKSAGQLRARKNGLRLYDPDQIASRRTQTKGAPAGGQTSGGGNGTINDEPWFHLISSNVDRIRYSEQMKELHVVFKAHDSEPARAYRYRTVEPDIVEAFKRTHSPGQFVWFVLRQYGYPCEEMGGAWDSSPAAPSRYDEQVFAVPEKIEAIQRKAGRKPVQGGMWNFGTPTGKKYNGPDTGAMHVPLG